MLGILEARGDLLGRVGQEAEGRGGKSELWVDRW